MSEKYKDEGWLREQYHDRDKSSVEMAEECGCAKSTILKYMRKNGIQRRGASEARCSGDVDRLQDEDWMREQYHESKKSTRELADVCGCSQTTIRRWLEKHDIETRDGTRSTTEKLNDSSWLKEQYHERGKSTYTLAEECGCSNSTILFWLSRHGIETRSKGSRVGSNHHNWNGGEYAYGAGWNEKKKRRVRERFGFECAKCGISQKKHQKEHDEKLHVHHLIKARQIDDAEERNSLSNLVALCGDCHRKYEHLAEFGLRPQFISGGGAGVSGCD